MDPAVNEVYLRAQCGQLRAWAGDTYPCVPEKNDTQQPCVYFAWFFVEGDLTLHGEAVGRSAFIAMKGSPERYLVGVAMGGCTVAINL